jgi:hypothetical protein
MPAASSRLVSLSDHPRAAPAIRRAKARGGLLGFALTALVGLSHGAPLEATLGRALVGGILANLIVWGVAVTVYKRVLVAEATAAAAAARRRAAAAETAAAAE